MCFILAQIFDYYEYNTNNVKKPWQDFSHHGSFHFRTKATNKTVPIP